MIVTLVKNIMSGKNVDVYDDSDEDAKMKYKSDEYALKRIDTHTMESVKSNDDAYTIMMSDTSDDDASTIMKFTNTIVFKGSPGQNINLIHNYLCNFDAHKCVDFGLKGYFMDAVIIFKLRGDICITSYAALKDDIKSGHYVEIFASDGDLIKQIKQYENRENRENNVNSRDNGNMTLKDKIAEIIKYNTPNTIKAKFTEHGQMIYDIVKDAEYMDKELDIIHEALTTLQNQSDANYDLIKIALNKVDKLKSK